MYLDEFEAMWTEQQKYYPQILTDVLKYGRKGKTIFPKEPEPLNRKTDLITEYGLYGILYFQPRRIGRNRWLGDARLSRTKNAVRGPQELRQRFRMVQEINNLMLLDRVTREYRSLSQIERETLVGFLSEKEKMTFDDIRKKLKLGDAVRFNFESGGRESWMGTKPTIRWQEKDFGKTMERIVRGYQRYR